MIDVRVSRISLAIDAALVIAGVLLFPTDAHAWGPIAHLDFGWQLLAGGAALTPIIRRLLDRHRMDFLYGNLAADAVVGKNRAKARDHCHSWAVARPLLGRARSEGEARTAMMLGFLGHLGADVVAHNHIIPKMMLTHYRAKGVGHLYWEARTDQRLLERDPSLDGVWQELSSLRFTDHDRFLARHLVAPLLPHAVSSRLYRQGLGIQRLGAWRTALRRIESRSRLALADEEVTVWRTLAVEATRRAVVAHDGCRLHRLDPTGRPTLEAATRLRRSLRRRLRASGEGRETDELMARALLEVQTVDLDLFEM